MLLVPALDGIVHRTWRCGAVGVQKFFIAHLPTHLWSLPSLSSPSLTLPLSLSFLFFKLQVRTILHDDKVQGVDMLVE